MLTELRTTLARDLEVTEVPVFTAWPARITPPCLFVTPPATSAYIAAGAAGGGASTTFGEYVVSADVVILVPQATPALALDALEALLETVLVNTADWMLAVGGCDSPSLVTVSGVDYLGTIVHLSKYARLE